MKKSELLNKPIILSLLLFVITAIIGHIINMILSPFQLTYGVLVTPLSWAISAFCLGIIYTSIYKIELPKNQKTKVILYYFFTTLPLLIIIHKLLIYQMLLVILVMIIGISCMYPALTLGCKIGLKRFEKKENQEI